MLIKNGALFYKNVGENNKGRSPSITEADLIRAEGHTFFTVEVCHPCPVSVLQAICDVSLAQISDVDRAVSAAKQAFEEGEWGRMNPRDRGRLIYKSVHKNIPHLFWMSDNMMTHTETW